MEPFKVNGRGCPQCNSALTYADRHRLHGLYYAIAIEKNALSPLNYSIDAIDNGYG
jgi:hypothetical protein